MVEGFIVYAKGWNDEQVASTIGDGVNTQQIGRFRARHIGNVRLVEAAKKPPTDSDALLSMIAELKADVERLNKALRNVAVEGNFERAYRILESQN